MKKLFGLMFFLVLSIGLFACGNDEPDPDPQPTEGWGYGLVHGHYVGIAWVEVDVDGLVSDMTLDEYFLPYNLATVGEAIEDETFTVPGRGGATVHKAKYFVVGDKLFTGANVDGNAVYSAEGIDDIEEWVKVEANAKWYVEQADAGNYFIANADGTEHDTLVNTDASASVSVKKSESGYWTVTDPARLGWIGNVEAMIAFIIGTALDGEDLVRDAEAAAGEQFWTVDGVDTGATWSDFPDYYELAQRAYGNAE